MIEKWCFEAKKAVLPVIHVESHEQAKRNIEVCIEKDADGCFLIGHGLNDSELIDIAREMTIEYDYWIGINCLGSTPKKSIKDAWFMHGVWSDNAFISPQREVYQGLYFGGVAFKYQKLNKTLEQDCIDAMQFVDIITTSGSGTGKAPDIEKIKKMRGYLGNFPLAVASGITVENVDEFLPYVDCFLVSTGISKDWQDLDPIKVSSLVEKVRFSE